MKNILATLILALFALAPRIVHGQKNSLLWATYFGGDTTTYGGALAIDSSGNIYMTGFTYVTSGIATKGAYQTLGDSINGDDFLVKFNSSGKLLWATYFGGSGYESPGWVCVDKSGNVYFTGYTNSTSDIATSGAYLTSGDSVNGDAFLAKFNSSGSILWSTYFGGKEGLGKYVITDTYGNVYITGNTSTDSGIATKGAYQTSGDSVNGDAFLAKFNSSGSILWATYYGGSGDDEGDAVAIDTSGNVYIAGETTSTSGIATSGAYQTSYTGGSSFGDAFLAKFSSSGNIIWATYYAENSVPYVNITTDVFNNIYITGTTISSSGISTSGAYQTFCNCGSSLLGDAFLGKFSTSGNLLWATYYGGSGDNEGDEVSTDLSGNVYISGFTNSTSGIATSNAYQTSISGAFEAAYIAKFDTSGTLRWASYYGGDNDTYGQIVTNDVFGNTYISGITFSTSGIATSGAFQTSNNDPNNYTVFLAKFNIPTYTDIKENKTLIYNISVAPNPFTSQTTISGNLDENGAVSISIYDITGRLITSENNISHPAGQFSYTFDASQYGCGICIVKLTMGNEVVTREIVKIGVGF